MRFRIEPPKHGRWQRCAPGRDVFEKQRDALVFRGGWGFTSSGHSPDGNSLHRQSYP
jgi:hypothetical protein